MAVFTLLLLKLSPLYLMIFLGFIAGKRFKVQKETIASLLIYVISPIIVFHGIATTPITLSSISLPILFFSIACILSLLFLRLSGKIWRDSTKNILAYTSGAANTGYFGLPVAVALFNDSVSGYVVLAVLGIVLFENTLGFYLTSRGNFSGKESVRKLLKLPALYALILGLLFNLSHLALSGTYFDTIKLFTGAYTILGMMLIGLGLSHVSHLKLDLKFLSLAFLAKFVMWPILIGFVILIDRAIIHLYSDTIHKVLILLSIVPLAANTVAYATVLKVQPEKAALAVLVSTIFALFYIPLVTTLFIH